MCQPLHVFCSNLNCLFPLVFSMCNSSLWVPRGLSSRSGFSCPTYSLVSGMAPCLVLLWGPLSHGSIPTQCRNHLNVRGKAPYLDHQGAYACSCFSAAVDHHYLMLWTHTQKCMRYFQELLALQTSFWWEAHLPPLVSVL